MAFTEDQVMLTLAALAYRGFQDVLPGALHEEIVEEALLDGLETFEPVQGEWDLVWGPATTRQVPLTAFRTLAVFDWSAMYVVRHRTLRNKYVIAIRGTNPVSSQDWLFGDLWVGTAVPWPYGSGKEDYRSKQRRARVRKSCSGRISIPSLVFSAVRPL